MPFADIWALPVEQLAAPDCVLLLWATMPYLPNNPGNDYAMGASATKRRPSLG
jgi:hypothetical protein